MPLLPEGEDARRGTGEVEEREQAAGAKPPPKPKPVFGGAKLPRGDLIVKFQLTLQADTREAYV